MSMQNQKNTIKSEENEKRLLRYPKLEGLVKSQFDRLQKFSPDNYTYRLLCRLGCYRYRNIPTLPETGLLCLLWDVPTEVDLINIID